MKAERIVVREVGPGDLDTAVHLISQLNGRTLPYHAVAEFNFSLDPSVFRAWVAYADDKPVGLTCFELRMLRWNDRELRAGYWRNLYVDPEYRKAMIYPRLVQTMRKEGMASGIEMIYSVIRRPEVAEAHQKLGFHRLGSLPVLIKPLRPFALLVKHKSLGEGLLYPGRILDRLYVRGSLLLGSRARSPELKMQVESIPEAAASMVEMLNKSGTGRISQIWKPEDFKRRFWITIENQPYEILTARSNGEIQAAVLCCARVKGNNINAFVILDTVFSPGKEAALEALLIEANKHAINSGCDCILFLEGNDETTRTILLKLGFRKSNEIYHMLVWPKERVPPTDRVSDLANWRFAFANHDAF